MVGDSCVAIECSLISDISTFSDTEENHNVVESCENLLINSGRLDTNRNFPANGLRSKQTKVRFESRVSDPLLCSSYNGSVDDLEDLTLVTPVTSVYSHQLHYRPYSELSKNQEAEISNQRNALEHVHEGSCDTSLWLDTMGAESSQASFANNNKEKIFRTTDHLPRQPKSQFRSTPLLENEQRPNENSVSSLITIDDCTPRIPHTVHSSEEISLSSMLELSSNSSNSLVDLQSTMHDDLLGIDLSGPKYKTARNLAREIKEISQKLEYEIKLGPSDEIIHEAECLVEEACNSNSGLHYSIDPLILNPGLTVNIPENVCTYTNLMDLSVDESEIVRQERQRIASQRRRMNQIRKQNAKDKNEEPEPDLLEFFDPNFHVFQSVNIHSKGLPTFLPSLSPATDDLSTIFHSKFVCDLARIYE